MQTSDTVTKIRHLFFAQHFTMNAIADSLGIHHDTVKQALDLAGKRHKSRAIKETQLAPFRDLIEKLLEKAPKLRSTRIMQILQDRGYEGGITQLRSLVAELRPKAKKAFLCLSFFPGEQAQVDWASFGSIRVGRFERKLSCFVMVLSYSRATFAVFTFDQTLESFLRCHILAFSYLGGVARTALYDNLKSAVVDREGTAISFNSKLLEMAGHYCFLPKAANIRAGWEKGRVERTIRYIRDNFFAGRDFRDLDQANRELREWLENVCNKRPWPDDRQRTVAEVWEEEKAKLMPKASHDFQTDYVGVCKPNKLCLVRYDRNDYSAPSTYVGKPLTLVASETTIRLLDGATELASHQRFYGKGERIRDPQHFIHVHEEKPQAHARTKRAEFIALIPESEEFFQRIIDSGRPTSNQTTLLFKYLDIYGAETLRRVMKVALKRDMCRASYVGQLLSLHEKSRSVSPLMPVIVPDHPQITTTEIHPHRLESYDEIIQRKDKEKNHE
jgi:transposase